MCRLFAAIGEDIPIRDYLLKFRELAHSGRVPPNMSPGHHDGWGIAASLGPSKMNLVAKSPTSAYRDPKYTEAVDSLPQAANGIVLAHLRKASRGRLTWENTHPFLEEGTAFMHNGTINFPPPEAGTQVPSDSLKYFHSLLSNFSQTQPRFWGEAFLRTLQEFASQEIGFSSATAVLSDSTGLWALRSCSKDEQYYTLYYIQKKGHIVVCQETLFPGNWTAIDNDVALQISLKDREMGVFPLKIKHF